MKKILKSIMLLTLGTLLGLMPARLALGAPYDIHSLLYPFYDPSSSGVSCQGTVAVGGSMDRYLQALAARESGGNPTASAGGSDPATGKYQYKAVTWKSAAQYYPPALQYAQAKDAPEEVQDALAYIYATVRYHTFNGDFFMVAATHEASSAGNDPSILETVYNGGKTVRQNAEELVQAMQGDAGKNIPLKYAAAPDFQTWLSKVGAPVDTGSSTATTSCSNPAGDFVFYSQTDPRWAGHAFGTSDIQTSGCGPTSVAMVVATLADASVTPIETADFGTNNGGFVEGQGSSWDGMLTKGPENWGLHVEQLGTDMNKALEVLKTGGLVIATGKGAVPYTDGGHVIVLRGISDSGKLLIGDPAHEAANTQEWDTNELLNNTRAMFGVTK